MLATSLKTNKLDWSKFYQIQSNIEQILSDLSTYNNWQSTKIIYNSNIISNVECIFNKYKY